MISQVKEQMDQVYEGLELSTPISQNIACMSTERIYFGKAVSLAPGDDMDEPAPPVNLFTDTESFFGVAIADVTKERLPDPTTGKLNSAPFGAFEPEEGITVKRKGKIWVVSDTQVTSRALGVYVRDEDNAGTSATVTSTTCTLANLAGGSFTVTIAGLAVQTVTFEATAPATVAAACATINAQLNGAIAVPVGAQILITTSMVGSSITIAAADIGTDLVWDTPVAGTGDVASYAWNSRGSFHAAAAGSGTGIAGYSEVTTWCKWLAALTVNSKYFGLLDIAL